MQADDSVQTDKLCQLAILNQIKSDLNSVNAHAKFGENPLIFTKLIVMQYKYGRVAGSYSCLKSAKFAPQQFQTRSAQFKFTYQDWWKSIDIY